ncbi:MAG: hypothetical protein ACUVTM_01915 [Candidatus Bathyarchaeia archaeon]
MDRSAGSCSLRYGIDYLLLFSIGLFLRGLPELLVEKYPVGYDTIAHYPFNIQTFGDLGLAEMLTEAPLFYITGYFSTRLLGMDVFTFLKFIGPILYGLTCISLYLFLRRCLGWAGMLSLLGALIFEVQLVSLRMSWDMFRLELGLIFMFITLVWAKGASYRDKSLAGVAAILTILSNQITGVILLFILLWISLCKAGSLRELLRYAAPFIPAGILFLTVLYLTFLTPPVRDPRLVTLGPAGHFLSYFEVDPRFQGGSYLLVARNIGILMLFCYGLLSILIVKGLFRNLFLDPTLFILSLGSFSPLLIPSISLPIPYWRWILLLIIPFSAYSARGLFRVRWLWRRRGLGLLLLITLFTTLSVGYASGTLPLRSLYFQFRGEAPKPPSPSKAEYGPVESVNTYIPASLVASSISADNVAETIDDCIVSLKWLNDYEPQNACLLVEERFISLAGLYTSRQVSLAIYGGLTPIGKVLEGLKDREFSEVYLLWYSDVNIDGFTEVYRHRSIAIYKFDR